MPCCGAFTCDTLQSYDINNTDDTSAAASSPDRQIMVVQGFATPLVVLEDGRCWRSFAEGGGVEKLLVLITEEV